MTEMLGPADIDLSGTDVAYRGQDRLHGNHLVNDILRGGGSKMSESKAPKLVMAFKLDRVCTDRPDSILAHEPAVVAVSID